MNPPSLRLISLLVFGILFGSSPPALLAQSGLTGLPVIAANSPLTLPAPSIPSGNIGDAPNTSLETQGGTVLSASPVAPLPALRPKTLYRLPPGPWGELEYYVTYLQIPESYVDLMPLPSEQTIWHFPETTEAEVKALLDPIGFPLLGDRPWHEFAAIRPNVADGGTRVYPPRELVDAITPEVRSALAALLRRSPENHTFVYPTVVESGDAVAWYRAAGLKEEIVQAIARLSYRKGKSLVFSDYGHVASMLGGEAERRRLMRTMTRTRSLVLRLNIGRTDDYDTVVDYWTAGHKQKALMPILESIAETPDVERIDAAHLLPPLARKLIYTYPDISDLITNGSPDCYWTCRNFFRDQPDSSHLDPRLISEHFSKGYTVISGPLRFGDVIAIRDGDTHRGLHAAVYIAGDIVFTKNGHTALTPWIFMRYGDMLSRYGGDGPSEVVALRRK